MAKDRFQLHNPNLPTLESEDNDHLYHLGLSRHKDDLPAIFGDVKFVCMGGTVSRMRQFIKFISEELDLPMPENGEFHDYAQSGGRYSMFKNGPVIAVNHGIGFASLGVLLNEILKLLYYAGCSDARIFRLGTCGGLGVQPGSVIVTRFCVDGLLRNFYEWKVLGRLVRRESVLDQKLCDELLECSHESDDFQIVSGTTLSSSDFFEGQARLDGAFCDYGPTEQMSYLRTLNEHGVVNIEMEALLLSAVCHHAGVKAAVVCVPLLDRFHGDKVTAGPEFHQTWEKRPQVVIARYIKKQLSRDT